MPRDQGKTIQNVSSARQRAKRNPRRKSKATGEQSTRTFETNEMTGDLPPFNDWATYVVDHESRKLYTYGGCRPGGEIIPTSDFYCCDMQTLRWQNYTHSLRYRVPYDPFSKEEHEARVRHLPRLQSASATFLAINGGRFVFVFGGHDPLKKQAVSDLIAIDVDNLSWWYVKIEGGPITGRIQSALVGIDNRLYVFGGKERFNTAGQSPSFASYCMAEYVADQGWRWTVRDQLYPPSLPSLGAGGKAVPVYGNKKILLTSGRSGDYEEVELSDQKTIFFHVENRTFQVAAETAGHFPAKAFWYEIFAVPSPQELALLRGSSPINGRRRKTPTSGSGPSSLLSPSPSVIFCTWLPHGDDFITPEIYQYLLPPEERLSCLNLKEKIWSLELDLQTFVVVAGRHFLLGYNKPEEDTPDTAAVYNVCVEITALR